MHARPAESGHSTSVAAPLDASRPGQIDYRDVMLLQAFNWDSATDDRVWYDVLRDAIPLIRKYAFTHVWLPPPTASVDAHGYMPTQLYDLDSNYGTCDGLRQLNRALLEHSLRPVADVVINHRAAEGKDENGVYNRYEDRVDHPGASLAWGKDAITCNDPIFDGKGRADTGKDYEHAADLDHTNPAVVQGLTDWLRWLRSHVGYEGWRLDYVYGYSPEVANMYLSETLDTRATVDGSLVGDFAVVEGWETMDYNGDGVLEYNQDRHRQLTVDWLDASGNTCAAFDFTLKGVLQEAISRCEYRRLVDQQGRAPGVNGWWPARAVTFLDNHDTGSSQRHWPFPEHAVEQGYAYILTHPGIPSLFWDHIVTDGGVGKLARLVELRKRAGIRADANMQVLLCTDTIYVAKISGSISDVLVKLGPEFDMGHAAPDDRWEVWASGKDWAAWIAKK